MHRTAFGLTFASELDLPELPPVEPNGQPPDVMIRFGAVDENAIAGGKQIGPLSWASPTELVLHIPDVARWLARDGREIVIDPCPGIDEDSLRLFMLGSVFAAILLQRGLFVLHGCSVQIGGSVLVAVGPSGIGKSTLAEGLRRQGGLVFADDVVAINGEGHALPGLPRIKLWHDVTEHLDIDRGALRRVRPDMQKYGMPISHQNLPTSAPVNAVYVLDWHHPDDVVITPVNRMNAFRLLLANEYRRTFVDGMQLQSPHLAMATRLAENARVARVLRPRDGFSLDPLVSAILDDLRG